MKKFCVFVFSVLMLIAFPRYSLAEQWYKGQYGCSYSDINTLRTLSNAIKFEVKYLGNLRNNEYGIQITNLPNELEVYYKDSKVDINNIISDLYPDTYHTFVIKVSDNHACKGLLEITKKVTIPSHNYYYDEDLCKGAENLEICDPNYDSSNITSGQFEQMIDDYKNSMNKKDTNKFAEFSKKYWYVYVISAIVIGGIVYFVVKRKKK